jgi:hypothetical protein
MILFGASCGLKARTFPIGCLRSNSFGEPPAPTELVCDHIPPSTGIEAPVIYDAFFRSDKRDHLSDFLWCCKTFHRHGSTPGRKETRPSEHRSKIALAAWWSISHGVVMAIQTVEPWIHRVHRNFTDVIVFLVIGVVLLALLPAKREVVAPGVA